MKRDVCQLGRMKRREFLARRGRNRRAVVFLRLVCSGTPGARKKKDRCSRRLLMASRASATSTARISVAAAFEFIGVTDLHGFQVSLSQQRDRHFAAIDTVTMLTWRRPRKVSMPKHWRSRKQRIRTEVPGGRLIAFGELPARDANWACMRPRSFCLGRTSADDRAAAGGKLP